MGVISTNSNHLEMNCKFLNDSPFIQITVHCFKALLNEMNLILLGRFSLEISRSIFTVNSVVGYLPKFFEAFVSFATALNKFQTFQHRFKGYALVPNINPFFPCTASVIIVENNYVNNTKKNKNYHYSQVKTLIMVTIIWIIQMPCVDTGHLFSKDERSIFVIFAIFRPCGDRPQT